MRRLTSQEEINLKLSKAASSLGDVQQKAAKLTDKTEMAFISEQQLQLAGFFQLHEVTICTLKFLHLIKTDSNRI